ncbi:MAG: hypothetical protein ACT4P2_03200 [Pseudomonadota bacterium]
MDEYARVNDLLALAGRLITLMNRENDLLRAMQPSRISELVHEKVRLARAYAAKVDELRRAPELFAALDHAVREEILEVTNRFDAAVQANERALRAAKDANERVIKAIVEAASAYTTTLSNYSPRGAVAARQGPDRQPALPVALDRKV